MLLLYACKARSMKVIESSFSSICSSTPAASTDRSPTLLAASLVVALYLNTIAHWILGVWLLSVVAAVWNVSRIDRKFIDIENRGVQWSEFTRQALGVAGCTIPWVAALMFFVPLGSTTDHYALWAIAAMLIAGSAAAMASAPVATVVFDLVVGAAGVASFILTGDFLFAIAAAAYTVTIVAGALRSARTYLSAKIAEAGVTEKDEVVSLLLREFEEKERSLQRPTSRGTVSFSPEVARDAAPEFYWRSRRAAEGDVPVPKPPGRGLCIAKARRAFEAESEQELPLADGDRVLIRYAEHHPSPGWIFAAMRRKAGYVPRNYLIIVDDAAEAPVPAPRKRDFDRARTPPSPGSRRRDFDRARTPPTPPKPR